MEKKTEEKESIVKRSERIDSKAKMEKAKENEKKRHRREMSPGVKSNYSNNSDEEEIYIPKKRTVNRPVRSISPAVTNGVKRGRGRPTKAEAMKVNKLLLKKIIMHFLFIFSFFFLTGRSFI